MDALTKAQKRIMKVLDAEIEVLETELAPFQKKLDQLKQLQQTRRVLLSEKSQTGGGGNANAKLTQEMVIAFLREHDEVTPDDIAKHYSVDNTIVRSHLNRHKNATYERTSEGYWGLIEEG